MREVRRGGTMACSLLLLVLGCTPDQPTPPRSGSLPPPTSTSHDDGYTRPTQPPAIDHPRDIKKFVGHPCSVLTPSQVADLGYPGKGRPGITPSSDVNCNWTDHGPEAELSVTLELGHNLLDEAYRVPAVDGYLLPYQVDGMPSVVRAPKLGPRNARLSSASRQTRAFSSTMTRAARTAAHAPGRQTPPGP